MNLGIPTRKTKRLLCISPKGAQLVKEVCGNFPSWDVCTVGTLEEAAKVLQEQQYLVGLLLGCIDFFCYTEMDNFLKRHPSTQWIGVVEKSMLLVAPSRKLMADHLWDYHTTPVESGKLLHTLGHVHGWACLKAETFPHIPATTRRSITGDSEAICRLRFQIERVAAVAAPVLICGESGSGKELVAKAIHDGSRLAEGPFVDVNCGAFPGNLIQSELFGYEKGAFTGAVKERKGLIESAQNGTIFLDEIAEMPMELQVNLLRFLQEKTIYRVGGTRSIKVNARIIAASHVDLQAAVAQGRFREDLYFRMNVLLLKVPPLRERKADLPVLVGEFFQMFSDEKNSQLKGVSNTAMDAIIAHTWPGNVRELMNRVRRAMVLAEGRMISAEDMGLCGTSPHKSNLALNESRAGAERHAIVTCLGRAGGNLSQAARELKISRMTLYRLIEKHGIVPSTSLSPDLETLYKD
ncbi:sigma 54-interacting transcriptional regulator [Massilia sp. TWP1-3-3]|uniref:sigma-54 dependent transcriptional regulator n=1 Tax=Massilia sp. TWP1-3-3 TaxID=2804573 RepID=UPI003CF719E1